jgi:hypothetical protein
MNTNSGKKPTKPGLVRRTDDEELKRQALQMVRDGEPSRSVA